MSPRTHRTVGAILGLALVAALAFGSPSAVAAPRDPVRADVTGNGTADLVVGAWPQTDREPGYLFLRDFRTGTRGQYPGERQQGPDYASLGEHVAHCDLDDDRYADVVSSLGSRREGQSKGQWGIQALYGAQDGRLQAGARITQASPRPPSFGDIACGDVNNDGVDEVAIGLPELSPRGRTGAGGVWLYPGTGLGPGRDRVTVNQEWPGLIGISERGDSFGSSVAFADLDDDGYDDLVTGAGRENPYYDHDDCSSFCGSVSIVFGSKSGLSRRTWLLDGRRVGVTGAFGGNLAVGDINGDGTDDIAVSATDHYAREVNAGAVAVVLGAPRTRIKVDQLVNQADSDVPGPYAAENGFGGRLAVGDVNGDGRDDVVVGVPRQRVGGKSAAGAIIVLPGTRTGVSRVRAQLITLKSAGVPGDPRTDDRWPNALAVLDTSGDGRAEIHASLVESPGGSVYRIPGSKAGADTRRTGRLGQPDVRPGGPIPGLVFGRSLVR